MKLLKFKKDYADEFDVSCIVVLSDKLFRYLTTRIEGILSKTEMELHFGTNEFLHWANYSEWKSDFEVVDITQEEYDIFKKYFVKSKQFDEDNETELGDYYYYGEDIFLDLNNWYERLSY